MEDVQIFATVLLGFAGALITLDKAIDIFKKWKKPSDDISNKVARHDKDIERLKDTVSTQTRMTNKAMLQIMNHMIDGNHTEKLIAVRDELQDYLINH